MTHLSIRLLGPFQVMLDEEPVTGFESDKVRALLAYLVVTPDQPHRREMLAGLLWPEYPERSARASLRNALANLRRTIGDHRATPPFLQISRTAIQFNGASDHWLDVGAFTAALSAPQPASQELENAVGHYRGTFLDGFSMPDSVAFEEWLLFKREELGRLAVETLHHLADTHEELGASEAALLHVRRWLELEPWQEEGHQRLIRLLARSGRRSEALAQYDRCRQLLNDELGVEPSAETQALQQAILSGELFPLPSKRPPDRGTSPHRGLTPLYNLPAQPTPFVGRRRELARLLELMAEPAVRALTIVGPGGMGKTRLALEVGARLSGNHEDASEGEPAPIFPHGIVFVPMAPLSSTSEILPAMADALQLRLERGQDQLFAYLRRRQLLLILDNVEHLEGAADLVAQILGAAPSVKVLVTSRAQLQLRGEHLFPLQGLAFPEEDPNPADLHTDSFVEAYPAVRLLVASALRVQPAFSVTPENLVTLTGICRAVEGMPLALELAAGWADTLSLDDILVEIKQSLGFLQTEWRDLPRRQRSMHTVFDVSWQRLDSEEQKLFPRLSVFRGGFTRAAVEQVAMEDTERISFPRLLARLVSKSFIQYSQALDRYQIHELLRQYGAERLAATPDREADVRDRHSAHYCAWLAGQEGYLKGAGQREAVSAIKADLDNARTALSWAASQGRAEWLCPAIDAIGPFYRWHNCQAGEAVFAGLAESLSTALGPRMTSSPVAQRTMARILIWQSTHSGLQGDYEQSRRLADESAALLLEQPLASQDTRLERSYVKWRLGYILRYTDAPASKEAFLHSAGLFEEVGDRWGQANALTGLGRATRNLREFEAASAAITEGLALRQDLGDRAGSAEALALLGHIAYVQARFAEAENLLRQSLALTQDLDREGVARALFHLGMTHFLSGRFPEAKRSVEESILLYSDLGIRHMVITGTAIAAQILRHLGDYAEARIRTEVAESEARHVGFDLALSWALGVQAALALARNDYIQAHERSEKSLDLLQQQPGYPSPLEGHLATSGLACRGLDRRAEAKDFFLTQLQRAKERWPLPPLLSALSGLALLLADKGHDEQAIELYALAARYPFVANSCWFRDVIGAEMEAAVSRLSPDTAQAARDRGQAADLAQVVAGLLPT